jgi:hypothetical protein
LSRERAKRQKEGKITEQMQDTCAQKILNGTMPKPQENRL